MQLIKDCFGDRFSNNEIFDRLSISRRTGYRALRNDDRIGKAPGRKAKIGEDTITKMIEYIESGGCAGVGNVWKHLADRFAPDCNPKTVQDAVKRRGFQNRRDTVSLEPLIDPALEGVVEDDLQSPCMPDQHISSQPLPSQNQQLPQSDPQALADAAFDQQMEDSAMEGAIESLSEFQTRYVLRMICNRLPQASQLFTQYFFEASDFMPPPPSNVEEPLAALPRSDLPSQFQPVIEQQIGQQLGQQMEHQLGQQIEEPMEQQMSTFESRPRRQRMAICRRCQQTFDRVDNTMENRRCLYHKGALPDPNLSPNTSRFSTKDCTQYHRHAGGGARSLHLVLLRRQWQCPRLLPSNAHDQEEAAIRTEAGCRRGRHGRRYARRCG